MSHIIPLNAPSVEQNWLNDLSNAISDPFTLLKLLKIDPTPWENGLAARKLFALRVPLSFVDKMEIGNPYDPLLRQILPLAQEFEVHQGYSVDPLEEQQNEIPGLLHKYHNRVLLIVKGGCAVNCRYCFRRHFPYSDNKGNKRQWQQSLEYIAAHPEINEVILSGGDPLMAKDHELQWLIEHIAAIPHIKRLRIHSRLPVVIPNRITDALCQILTETRLQTILVTHINHANEIDDALKTAMQKLKQANVTLLNQGVLLKGVNDSVAALTDLSETLFDAGIQPYYLHVLDRVQGAAHFMVDDEIARQLMAGLITKVSGYLVPKLTREIGGRASKTPLDLLLE
ncbi:EF-P beta-lysylation protein EpmB [Photobacterium leiognathi]|uniref:L-lysine 2,3-aminomutase n=1 Tax=Photobacterium leiognathi subsp. mandapamensis TaxID=48408 RepID=A0A2T3KRJ3_PHOLD|nr:EF-P beta-lysylation protein EpmB [Photobacterium leiognathi]PSU93943.1 EF-P beta-lysylation protein EpmB [Photobacterium leiognathi subsp. mandapamensis]PSV08909.1 EF-P beta-lysylation protein EpmB [Photobacterium leiognathi subsp. mandapamensis]PSW49002.1 EF-P beta-lysylation protein EpmB [Photobacterium leiognathi subsp. mandapamensis]GAA03136.1 kamA family protein [Photobacterium leiognathi subsp. mandapamensis svers.1.1.]